MRVLVNYSKADKPHLAALAYILRNAGITALSTVKDLTIGELLGQAKQTSCDAILCCNEQTLRYLVPGETPTLDKWRGSRLNYSVPVIVINRLEHIRTVPRQSHSATHYLNLLHTSLLHWLNFLSQLQ